MQKLNFCTLFDKGFLSRGLSLYDSLKNQCENFHLYVFAFDNTCYKTLKKLNLENMTVISLQEFEDEKLLAIKPTRTHQEYCWTCTPSTIHYVLHNFPEATNCTYVDADMYFYHPPQGILDEMPEGKSVLITKHNYFPTRDFSKDSGIYCVQFMYFKNNDEGRMLIETWRDQCIDWCYARFEDGKFGDQKYLDNWESDYNFVWCTPNEGAGVAPWNHEWYTLSEDEKGNPYIHKEDQQWPLYFYHFHALRYVKGIGFTNQNSVFEIPELFKEKIYVHYCRLLDEVKDQLRKKLFFFDVHGTVKPPKKTTLIDKIKYKIQNR